MTHKLLKVLLIAMIAMMPFTLAVNIVRAETGSTTSPSAGATKIDRSKLLLGPRDSASTPALTEDPAGWIMGKQQQFYRSMSLAIRDIGRCATEFDVRIETLDDLIEALRAGKCRAVDLVKTAT